MSIRLGQKANFECIVDGTPIPSVSWQHSGRNLDFTSGHYKVENNGRLHTLTIDAVLERNAGSYMCMASNEYGFVLSTPATLNVEDNTGEYSTHILHFCHMCSFLYFLILYFVFFI